MARVPSCLPTHTHTYTYTALWHITSITPWWNTTLFTPPVISEPPSLLTMSLLAFFSLFSNVCDDVCRCCILLSLLSAQSSCISLCVGVHLTDEPIQAILSGTLRLTDTATLLPELMNEMGAMLLHWAVPGVLPGDLCACSSQMTTGYSRYVWNSRASLGSETHMGA